jgi:hypothetical protein
MTELNADTTIKAYPTKAFFMRMLVKDIPLIRAILDIVDNSVDGALRTSPEHDYKDLWVRVEMDQSHFRVVDNCGGIDWLLARDYAFRFGRPDEMSGTEHSVGHFGVGMKRALFKLGTVFTIESTARTSRFVVDIDVEDWKKDPDDWTFKFAHLETDLPEIPQENRGTTITVSALHEAVAEEFALENLRTEVGKELQAAHQLSMSEGLAISLNGVPLNYRPIQLLHSDQMQPAHWEWTSGDPKPVRVQLWTGLSDSVPSAGGWYVFCNGRMVMEADQTISTGWGEGNLAILPKYHNQYARFRGYAYFDCDDPGLLPWNTTKTGVDSDSPLFSFIRQHMITLSRPVITFLNKLKIERQGRDDEEEVDDGPLTLAVKEAQPVRLADVVAHSTFVPPKAPPAPRIPLSGRIQYDRLIEDINKVKRKLNVRSYKEVGEQTFDYFLDKECSE